MDAHVSPGRSHLDAGPNLLLRHSMHFGPLAVLSVAAAILAAARLPADTAAIGIAAYAAVVGLNVLAIAMSSWCTVLGAVDCLAARAGRTIAAGPVLAPPTGRARTALLMPVHEEDAPRVFAAARVMCDALAAEGAGLVEGFVLSDSRSAAAMASEAAMVAATRIGSHVPLFYRRRADNRGRKAGNIADFVRRWGARYDFMIVLDADSLMSGPALARLVGAMEANPRAALIQAMCYPVGRHTVFARLSQFNARLHGPLFQRGVSLWQGPRGNFWGHNAILRSSAFASSCGLPDLPGRPPLGGEIMSHDTVEAALLLRRDHDVWMLPNGPDGRADGSWEETPTNLLDHYERDRRWCRGNLQHLHVLRAEGLKLASLYHLTRGLLHYLYAPLAVVWLGLFVALDRRVEIDALVVLLAVLFGVPRLLGLAAAWPEARGFGGRGRLVAGFVVDQIVVLLCYPTTVAVHLHGLAGVLRGIETRWDAQSRADRSLTWRAACRALMTPMGLALMGAGVLFIASPRLAAMTGIASLAIVPIAVLGSRSIPTSRFLSTPEDVWPHPIRACFAHVESSLRARNVGAAVKSDFCPPDDGLTMPLQQLRDRDRRVSSRASPRER